ncbi:MAG: trypsin-like peptidase domain-containing protein [Alphaproteobacteria bacterium]|nr:trypsin-like peptidase domain-containing protein [Alphaproteobacteria bacterium]
MRSLVSLIALVLVAGVAAAQDGPSRPMREGVLRSLVHISADRCPDGAPRAGSGFAYESPGRIVTAHHVVGGCGQIVVTYEGVPQGASRQRPAGIARVLSIGDLALLEVRDAPAVPALRLARPPADKARMHAGFGYQNGQLTAGDQDVRFSVGAERLVDILPPQAQHELAQSGSRIDIRRTVLRFNVALQPGMSGGPIIDTQGAVVGIVAGGLKAGAAPASWGWPAEWVADLMTSNEARDQSVRVTGAYYSLSDMQSFAQAAASGRRVRCGHVDLEFRGTRGFHDVARGSDDYDRLQYLLSLSGPHRRHAESLRFDVWVHPPTGGTVLTPAGYPISHVGEVCVVRSPSGPFMQVIWGGGAIDRFQYDQIALFFEQRVMFPLAPYNFGFEFDQALTTPGPQLRPNGMIFNRKGFSQPKVPWMPGGPPPPLAHSFETLIAKAGTFLGVGTVNNDMPPGDLQRFCMQGGQAPPCPLVHANLLEWTRFILATQLSTFPAT